MIDWQFIELETLVGNKSKAQLAQTSISNLNCPLAIADPRVTAHRRLSDWWRTGE